MLSVLSSHFTECDTCSLSLFLSRLRLVCTAYCRSRSNFRVGQRGAPPFKVCSRRTSADSCTLRSIPRRDELKGLANGKGLYVYACQRKKKLLLRKHSRGACNTRPLWQSMRLKEAICRSAVASPGHCKHCRYDAEVRDDKALKHGLAKQTKSPRGAPKMKRKR